MNVSLSGVSFVSDHGDIHQRLDSWLWCARLLKTRSGCATLVASGALRLNRRPTDKPHARLRPGDTLTIAQRQGVRVLRVRALAARRGPAAEARALYDELPEAADPACAKLQTPA